MLSSQAGAAHILVVDDDGEISHMLEQMLSGDGYRVSVVNDGQEALDWLAGARPDEPRLREHAPARLPDHRIATGPVSATLTQTERVEARLWDALRKVEDPEIPVSVVGMGLIVSLAYSDLLAMAPKQWTEFAPTANALATIPVREILPAPPNHGTEGLFTRPGSNPKMLQQRCVPARRRARTSGPAR